MEALHQLAELFQQAVTKNDNTHNSVAPPKMMPARQDPTITPTHDAYPHHSNIIEDDDGNQPQKLDHRSQPLGLGLPPQRNNSMPHYIPPDSVTSPRVAHIHRQPVTPSPRVEKRHGTKREAIPIGQTPSHPSTPMRQITSQSRKKTPSLTQSPVKPQNTTTS